MKRSCSVKNLDSISQYSIPFHLAALRESSSLSFLDETKCHLSSIVRSLSSLSFKRLGSRSCNSVVAVEEENRSASSLTPSVRIVTERVAVSLSALDKEIETSRCTERKSLSLGDRICSASRNSDLHDKSDRIPHFCEDLSTFVKEPSFEPSLSYFASRHNNSPDRGSVCSEIGTHDTEYVSADAITVKDDQEWRTANDVPEISQPGELSFQQELHPEKLPTVNTAIGSVLNLLPRIVCTRKLKKYQEDSDELIQELDRQPEMNEINLKSRRSYKSVEFGVANPVSCSTSFSNNHTPISCGSSRELSVISEHTDGHFENEENYNCERLLDEPEPLVDFSQSERRGDFKIYCEREVDADAAPQVQRWFCKEQSSGEKVIGPKDQNAGGKNVSLRCLPCRSGELQGRCKSQFLLEPENDYVNWSELQKTDKLKSLSSSSPSVNEMILRPAQDIPNEAGRNKRRQDITGRRETPRWKENLPVAFGPHQVFGPLQRPSRQTNVTDSIRGSSTRLSFAESSRSEKKARIEKKHTRKSSAILDFFRKPDLRGFSDVVTPIADRRSTIAEGFDALPDALAKALLEKVPNTIGVTDGRFLAAHLNRETQRFIPQINKPRWADLDLWSEEPATWSSSNHSLKLSKKERKKQDIIYELYLTEKHHCQVLVILQQVYQEGLRVRGILEESRRDELIPAVLDALLDFHLHFLRRLCHRRSEALVVDSVSDIVYSEFENGERNQAAIHAYTEFCSKYDRCGRLYDEWRTKNAELRKFFDQYEQDVIYKGRTFKMCLLLVAQRLTKYPVLLEKLSEMESGATKEGSLRAYAAVKKFAMNVNNEIAKIEMNRRWDAINSRIDRSSKGRFGPNDVFSYEDLILNGSDEVRCLLCIGGAICQNSQKKTDEGTEVVLVLFDDILVLFANSSSNKYVFYDRGSGSSVIALNKLIVREVPRSTKLFFLVADDPCFDLFVVSFASKADVEQWKQAIESSKERAPKRVKRAMVSSVLDLHDEEDPEERKFNQDISKWEQKLREFFEKRIRDERELSNYIEKRLAWFELLRAHLREFPLMDRTETNRNAVREKVKGLVKGKFAELRAARRSSLSRVVERAERVYEDDFMSFFDDAYDAAVGTSDHSHSTDQSESDEGRQKLPRRNRTFSGVGEHRKGGSIRRHTTEPKMAEAKFGTEEHDSTAEDEEIRKLPLHLGPVARRAAVSIIRENAQLRIENNQLRSEIAFRELRIASLKSRRLAAVPASALEALRNKQNELQNDKRSFQTFYEFHVEEINRRTKELEEKEAELKAREEQLQEQWIKFYEMNSSDSPTYRSYGMSRPMNSTPALDRSFSVRSMASLSKSSSGSSMPLHLAEKSAKIWRPRK